MPKLLPSILLCALSAACTRTNAAAPAPGKPEQPTATARAEVELVSKKRMQSLDGQIFARFRVVNRAADGIAYVGWSEDSPSYTLEVQEGGAWLREKRAWQGKGLLDFTIQPGAEMAFDVPLPADGRTYRATFGEPLVVTPTVVAAAP